MDFEARKLRVQLPCGTQTLIACVFDARTRPQPSSKSILAPSVVFTGRLSAKCSAIRRTTSNLISSPQSVLISGVRLPDQAIEVVDEIGGAVPQLPAGLRARATWEQHGGNYRQMMQTEARAVGELMVSSSATGLRRVFIC